MSSVYEAAVSAGDRATARYCRRQAIEAKNRAKLAAGRPNAPPELAARKSEMAQWMLVWLENPEVFPAWVVARKRAREIQSGVSPDAGPRPSESEDPA
jgi:hypothetical protein